MRGSFFRLGVAARTYRSVKIVAPLQWSASKQMANKLRIGFAGAGAISSGSPFPTDRLDNLETLKLMESCYLSAGVKF